MSDCTIGRFDYRALADFAFGDGDAGVVEALEQAMIAVADAVAHGSCVEDATFGLSSAPSDPALSPAVPLSPAGNLVRDPASFKDAYVAFSEGLDSANDVYEKDAYMRVCKGVPMPDREALMDSLAKRLEGVLEPVRPLLRQDAWPTGGDAAGSGSSTPSRRSPSPRSPTATLATSTSRHGPSSRAIFAISLSAWQLLRTRSSVGPGAS